MNNFEDWYEDYLPLIYGAMKYLKIQNQRDEFYQIELVALWEASVRYHEERGKFESYAYSYILNRMKTAMSRMNTYGERFTLTEDKYLNLYQASHEPSDMIADLVFETYLHYLTKNQQAVVVERYLYNHSVIETSNNLGISIDAVKNRTRDALKKLRKMIKRDEEN